MLQALNRDLIPSLRPPRGWAEAAARGVRRWSCICFSVVFCLSCPPPVSAQPESEVVSAPAARQRAPRVFALSIASSYAFSSALPLSPRGEKVRPWGLQAGARFGWQVGGLAGARASWIGFETELALQPGSDYRSSYGLLYGLFAKHALTRHMRWRPYFGYGLGAGQVWVKGVDGRGIGHVTRVELGVDVRIRERRHLIAALIYQAVIMPSFARADAPAEDTSFHAAVLATGIWFGH